MEWLKKNPPIRKKLLIAFGALIALIILQAVGVLFVMRGLAPAALMEPDRAYRALSNAEQAIVLIAASTTAIALALSWLFRKAIADPYVTTVVRMEALADGDLEGEILFTDYQDCVGRMTRAMHSFRDAAVARIEAEQALRNSQDQRTVVSTLSDGLKRFAQGDFSKEIEARFGDEYEELRTNFNIACASLQETLSAVSDAATSIRSGSSEISSASDDLARRTEQQAANLEETASAMSEITDAVSQTAVGAQQVDGSVSDVHLDATEGGRIVQDAIGAMGDIQASSQEIAQIINVIDGIAFQTNLLALNAGVEAARAGDAGKGFAVVANEVRALAQRSADAASNIKELIGTSTKQVERGVDLVGRTGAALDRIVTRIGAITEQARGISSAAELQANGLKQVNMTVADMDKMTQQNAAMVEQATAAARSLADRGTELQALVNRFVLAGHARTNVAREDITQRHSTHREIAIMRMAS